MTERDHEEFVGVTPAPNQEPWTRAVCPICGRLAVWRKLDVDAAARSVLYRCPSEKPIHEWRTTWARP